MPAEAAPCGTNMLTRLRSVLVHPSPRRQIQTCMRACVHACVRACMHVYVHVCTHACMRARVHACIRTCAHACTHACMRAHEDLASSSPTCTGGGCSVPLAAAAATFLRSCSIHDSERSCPHQLSTSTQDLCKSAQGLSTSVQLWTVFDSSPEAPSHANCPSNTNQ